MTLRTVQAVRAIAALLVVLFHSLQMWGERVDPAAPGSAWGNGAAGVDIFFVISGLVMALSTRELARHEGAGLTFLWNRIVRIVPLYWLLTSLKLVAVLAAGAWALRSETDIGYIASSYLFLPVIDHAGNFRPLLPVGWTLTFEFMFYLIFAAALAIRVPPLRLLVPLLTGIACVGLMRNEAWPTATLLLDPIVLEFLFGLMLAEAFSRGWRLPTPIAVCAVSLGAAFLLLYQPATLNLRVVLWGLPALAIVAGAISLEQELAPLIPKWLLGLGNASYSLYLVHGFILPVVGLVIVHLGLTGLFPELVTVGVCLIGCSLVAAAVYKGAEKPMLAMMRRRRSPVPIEPQLSAS